MNGPRRREAFLYNDRRIRLIVGTDFDNCGTFQTGFYLPQTHPTFCQSFAGMDRHEKTTVTHGLLDFVNEVHLSLAHRRRDYLLSSRFINGGVRLILGWKNYPRSHAL